MPSRLKRPASDELDVLFARYSRLVFATAYHVLGDPSEAEEIVQEVFLYLHRKPALYDPAKGSVKAWISQITLCRARDRKSYLAHRPFFAADMDLLHVAGRMDLERQIDAKLGLEHLEKMLAELTPMQRQTIWFFYFEGLDLKDISKELSQPIGNVRHYFYRGLDRLRKSKFLQSFCCK